MDRQQAIAQARYLRCGATAFNMEDGTSKEYIGKIPHHFVNSVKIINKKGQKEIVPKHRTKFTDGPSTGAAKRAMRGLKNVVAAQDGTEEKKFRKLFEASMPTPELLAAAQLEEIYKEINKCLR